jgi:hypothetical protein
LIISEVDIGDARPVQSLSPISPFKPMLVLRLTAVVIGRVTGGVLRMVRRNWWQKCMLIAFLGVIALSWIVLLLLRVVM